MEKKKNIILITGKDSVSIGEEVLRLTTAWRERQSDDNIHRYTLSEISDWRQISELTQAMGLFVEKRLFIFTGSLEQDRRKKKKGNEAEDTLMRIIEHIDDDTFLIFLMPSTGSNLEKYIEERGDVRKYDHIYDRAKWYARYRDLDPARIDRVLSIYEDHMRGREDMPDVSSLIRESLEKISLLSIEGESPSIEDERSIDLSETGKMYDLIDMIMRGDALGALKIYRKVRDDSGAYAFLPSLIGLMRNAIYTRYLKQYDHSESEIVSILGAHPFVVKKSYNTRIAWGDLQDFYDKILEANIAYRSGRGLYDPELGRNFAIERAILSLKK